MYVIGELVNLTGRLLLPWLIYVVNCVICKLMRLCDWLIDAVV